MRAASFEARSLRSLAPQDDGPTIIASRNKRIT